MGEALVRYRNVVADSVRWDGFAFRDGDIVISTPPKCGTTWTQMICALLIFQTDQLPRPLDELSPWLDQTLSSRDDVFASLEAQQHRRFIKTHTPLDGLPFEPEVTYICVGRDLRDVAISMDNHMNNIDFVALFALREKAVGLDDLAELMPDGPPVPAATEYERFWQWIDEGGLSQMGLGGAVHHLATFWNQRFRPNIVMLHYGELTADLEGEMRRLADRLGIEVPDERWPDLVAAASFERMKGRATDFAPNATSSIWQDNDRFFNRGTCGQWQALLNDEDLRRYAGSVEALADPDLITWMHQGPITG